MTCERREECESQKPDFVNRRRSNRDGGGLEADRGGTMKRILLAVMMVAGAGTGGVLAAGARGWQFGISWGGVGTEALIGVIAGTALYGLGAILLKVQPWRVALGVLAIAVCAVIMAEGWCAVEEASFAAEVKRTGASTLYRERCWPYSSSSMYVHDGKFGAHD